MGSSSERDKVLRTHPTTRAGARANTPFLLCHSFVRNSLITFDKFCPSTSSPPLNSVECGKNGCTGGAGRVDSSDTEAPPPSCGPSRDTAADIMRRGGDG